MTLPGLYLCRHGQTDWNAKGRLQGQEDVPLNTLGRSQARRNGRYLRNVLGARAADWLFLSSPLSRAVETMRIIRGELGLPPDEFHTDDRLLELDFGRWQGSTLAEVRTADAAALARRRTDKWNFVPPGEKGESYAMLLRRVEGVFADLYRPAIITAHGGVTRSFLKLYGGLDERAAAHADIPQDRILRYDRDAPEPAAFV